MKLIIILTILAFSSTIKRSKDYTTVSEHTEEDSVEVTLNNFKLICLNQHKLKIPKINSSFKMPTPYYESRFKVKEGSLRLSKENISLQIRDIQVKSLFNRLSMKGLLSLKGGMASISGSNINWAFNFSELESGIVTVVIWVGEDWRVILKFETIEEGAKLLYSLGKYVNLICTREKLNDFLKRAGYGTVYHIKKWVSDQANSLKKKAENFFFPKIVLKSFIIESLENEGYLQRIGDNIILTIEKSEIGNTKFIAQKYKGLFEYEEESESEDSGDDGEESEKEVPAIEAEDSGEDGEESEKEVPVIEAEEAEKEEAGEGTQRETLPIKANTAIQKGLLKDNTERVVSGDDTERKTGDTERVGVKNDTKKKLVGDNTERVVDDTESEEDDDSEYDNSHHLGKINFERNNISAPLNYWKYVLKENTEVGKPKDFELAIEIKYFFTLKLKFNYEYERSKMVEALEKVGIINNDVPIGERINKILDYWNNPFKTKKKLLRNKY
jgi:hypothetical protein